MKNVFTLVLVLCLASCNTIRVNYDYDKGTDFTNYSTYNYYPDMNTGLSELDTKRLLHAVNAEMQAKGIRFSEDPPQSRITLQEAKVIRKIFKVSDGSQPFDTSPDDSEPRNDFGTIAGNYNCRHHVEPRVELYVPNEESFPIPIH